MVLLVRSKHSGNNLMLIYLVVWISYHEEVFLLGNVTVLFSKVKLLKMWITYRFTHLQHTAFTYNIQINNSAGSQVMGTCRIFLAPKFDERGTAMLFRDQRLLMTEMDKFIVACKLMELFTVVQNNIIAFL